MIYSFSKYSTNYFTSLLRSRNQSLHALGTSSALTYQDLNKAICGFNSVIRFDDAKVFSCPSCGSSPKYIVADGKSDGPVKRKVWTCNDIEIDIGFSSSLLLPQPRPILSSPRVV